MTTSLSGTSRFAARLWRLFSAQPVRCDEKRDIALNQGATWSGHLEAGQTLRCVDGCVWITQTNDATDYIVQPGAVFTAPRAGRIVVQALRAARVQTETCLDNIR